MRIAIPKEKCAGEKRCAASPDTVKKYVALGFDVNIEKGAGENAFISDQNFKDMGAHITADFQSTVKGADMVLKVRAPMEDELDLMKDTILIGLLNPYDSKKYITSYAQKNIQAFSMELLPRISRAQSMDVLSSQSNIAGYRAVLDAACAFGRIYPLLMTSAGMLAPARVVVVGAGVAGLQAIATAKRLGAVVSAFDVRATTKEQVESLGANFIEVEQKEGQEGETSGGYAKEMDDDYKRRQAEKLHEVLKKTDIVITTALIPGRQSPLIVTQEMLNDMKAGSVLVDLAIERGGNVAGAVLGKEVVLKNGVKILGYENIPSRVPFDTTQLYARNLLNFIEPMVNKEKKSIEINLDDEVISGTLLTNKGQIVHPNFMKGE